MKNKKVLIIKIFTIIVAILLVLWVTMSIVGFKSLVNAKDKELYVNLDFIENELGKIEKVRLRGISLSNVFHEEIEGKWCNSYKVTLQNGEKENICILHGSLDYQTNKYKAVVYKIKDKILYDIPSFVYVEYLETIEENRGEVNKIEFNDYFSFEEACKELLGLKDKENIMYDIRYDQSDEKWMFITIHYNELEDNGKEFYQYDYIIFDESGYEEARWESENMI